MSGNPWNTFLKMNKNNGYKMRELSQIYQQSGGRYRCHKNIWREFNKYNINLLLLHYKTLFNNLGLEARVSDCTDGIIINFYSNNVEVCHLTIPCNSRHWFEPYGPFDVHFTVKKQVFNGIQLNDASYYFIYDQGKGKLNYKYTSCEQNGGTKRPFTTGNDSIQNKKQRLTTYVNIIEESIPDIIEALAIIMSAILTDVFDTDTIQRKYNTSITRNLLKNSEYTNMLKTQGFRFIDVKDIKHEITGVYTIINLENTNTLYSVKYNVKYNVEYNVKYKITIYWYNASVNIKRYNDKKHHDESYNFNYNSNCNNKTIKPPYEIKYETIETSKHMIYYSKNGSIFRENTSTPPEGIYCDNNGDPLRQIRFDIGLPTEGTYSGDNDNTLYKTTYKQYNDDIVNLILILNKLINNVVDIKYINDD